MHLRPSVVFHLAGIFRRVPDPAKEPQTSIFREREGAGKGSNPLVRSPGKKKKREQTHRRAQQGLTLGPPGAQTLKQASKQASKQAREHSTKAPGPNSHHSADEHGLLQALVASPSSCLYLQF